MRISLKLKKFFSGAIGTRSFYAAVLAILIPLVIQQGITNLVNLLDNIMVGQLGTEEISAVAIVNQIIFILYLTIFGVVAGVSIFGAQFYGKGDIKGLQFSLRLRTIMAVIVAILGIFILSEWGEVLISFFLNETEGDTGDIPLTLTYAKSYLTISLWGFVPFALTQCFASTLKDCGETKMPMNASIVAIGTNLVLNYLLIFGTLGFPRLGVAGAAIATAISRYVESVYIIVMTHRRRKRFPFIIGAFQSLRVPAVLLRRIIRTGAPLILNELLWALGTTIIAQSYSVRGLSAVTAVNINNTIWNVFSVVSMATGHAIGILAGQRLGANNIDGAKDVVKKLTFFSVLLNIGIGAIIILTSSVIPNLYNTTNGIRRMAAQLLIISGLVLPIEAYTNATYFSIRSGGRTLVTFLFDSVFIWAVSLPAAWILARFSPLPLVQIFLLIQLLNLIKVVIGFFMIRSGIWAKNVVNDSKAVTTFSGSDLELE